MSIRLAIINATDTFPVRHKILRKGKPISSCAFHGDDAPQTFHLGAYLNQELVGVASFMQEDFTEGAITKTTAYQLRGMAVLETHHKKGVGAKLLAEGERLIKEKGIALLWMNARIKAVGFYEKFQYKTHGGAFEIAGVGAHYKMYKPL